MVTIVTSKLKKKKKEKSGKITGQKQKVFTQKQLEKQTYMKNLTNTVAVKGHFL